MWLRLTRCSCIYFHHAGFVYVKLPLRVTYRLIWRSLPQDRFIRLIISHTCISIGRSFSKTIRRLRLQDNDAFMPDIFSYCNITEHDWTMIARPFSPSKTLPYGKPAWHCAPRGLFQYNVSIKRVEVF